MELIAFVARLMWFRRNALINGRHVSPIQTVVTHATEALVAFHRVQLRPASTTTATQPKDTRWEAPPAEFVKANWDAALEKETKKMGIGVIVRDSKGGVFVTFSSPKAFIIDLAVAKANAAL